jgi:hypothetical protein
LSTIFPLTPHSIPPAHAERHQNSRFPGDLISHEVWLYYRYSLSYRDVQEILMERGITVSHEAMRQWCGKFGQDYANQLRRRQPRPGDQWYLDEAFLTIHGTLPLPVVGGGSRRSRPRYPGAESAQQERG